MTSSTHGDKVIRMITMCFSPVIDMMHVKLGHVACGPAAKDASISVTALDQFPDGMPALATIPVSPTLPVTALFSCQPIGRVVLARSASQALHSFWAEFAVGVALRMLAYIFYVAVVITKLAFCMGVFTSICLAAVGAHNVNAVSPVSQAAAALSRARKWLVGTFWICLPKIVPGDSPFPSAPFAGIRDHRPLPWHCDLLDRSWLFGGASGSQGTRFVSG